MLGIHIKFLCPCGKCKHGILYICTPYLQLLFSDSVYELIQHKPAVVFGTYITSIAPNVSSHMWAFLFAKRNVIKNKNKVTADVPEIGNGLIKMIMVGKSISQNMG